MIEKNYLVIGRVRTSYGLKGYVKIQNFSGETDHFIDLKEVNLESGSRKIREKIEDVIIKKNDILMKFEGINTPEDARKYINHEIWVPRSRASRLDKGEYYFADLCGCILTGKEKKYGTVKSIIEGGSAELLEIEYELEDSTKKTFLVPFRNEFIGEINLEKKTIELLTDWIIP